MSDPNLENFGIKRKQSPDAPDRVTATPSLPESFHTRMQEERDALKRLAQCVLDLRQRRVDAFGQEMFSEPAWELLLRLYASEAESVDVHDLLAMSRISALSGRRWLNHLAHEDWIRLTPVPDAARAQTASLTDQGRNSLDAYLTELRAELGDA